MADSIRIGQYFKVQVADKPGEAARMLGVVRDAGINLIAFSGFPRARRGQLDFIPDSPVAFKNVAKQAKWKVQGPKPCFLVNGEDRPGAIAEVMAKVAAAKINITAIDAVCGGQGRYGALFWVKPRDVKKVANILSVG